VNRELDTLRAIFSKAIEWGELREHPMRAVKRLKVDNRRTRILTEAEQLALLAACPKKLAVQVRLALITGARFGELLALRWGLSPKRNSGSWRRKMVAPGRYPSARPLAPL